MDSSDSSSIFQTLAGALTGGLQGYVDSQNTAPVYVTQPQPQTQYGSAGVNQNTGTIAGLNPTMLLLIGGVVLFLVLRK